MPGLPSRIRSDQIDFSRSLDTGRSVKSAGRAPTASSSARRHGHSCMPAAMKLRILAACWLLAAGAASGAPHSWRECRYLFLDVGECSSNT